MIAERGRGRGGVAGVLSSLQGRCRRSRRGGRILPRDAPKVTDSARFPSPSRDSVTSRKAGAARVAEGDGFCHEVSQGRRIPAGFRLPRVLSRHPDGGAAARLPEGDASCRETARGRQDPPAFFSFGRFRDKPSGQLPRDCPKGTDSAAERPKGDGFRPISVSLACSRGTRRSAGVARPPSTQEARLERRASNTKLCSRTRAYRLSASTGQEEMQAPHSMHSSSLTSA